MNWSPGKSSSVMMSVCCLLVWLVLLGFFTAVDARRHYPRATVGFARVPPNEWLLPVDSGCVKLNCDVISDGDFTVTYRINGIRLNRTAHPNIRRTESGSLIICRVNLLRHVGTYRCDASNRQGSRSYKEVILTASLLRRYVPTGAPENRSVTPAPSVAPRPRSHPTRPSLHCPPVIHVITMRTINRRQNGRFCVEVVCAAEGCPGPLDFRFKFKGQLVPNPALRLGMRKNGDVLSHCNNRLSALGGVYTCIASNSLQQSATKTLNVQIAELHNFIHVENFAWASNAVSGRSCSDFTCSAEGMPAPLTYTFTLNDRPVPLVDFQTLGNTLRYCGSSLPDGTYECTAVNALGTSASKEVFIPPSPAITGFSSQVVENCLTLTCSATPSDATATIDINERTASTEAGYVSSGNAILTLCNVDRSRDRGTARCTAADLYGRSTVSRIRITDADLPRTPVTGGDADYGIRLSINAHNCLIVDCITASGESSLQINGGSAVTSDRYRLLANRSIEVCDVKYRRDSGYIDCHQSNPYRLYRKQVSQQDLRELMKSGPCSPPTAANWEDCWNASLTVLSTLSGDNSILRQRVAELEAHIASCPVETTELQNAGEEENEQVAS